MRRHRLALLVAGLSWSAGAIAGPRQPAVPTETWLTTDRARYEVGGMPNSAVFDATVQYTNYGSTPRYFTGCGAPSEMVLQKLMGGLWVTVYGNIVAGCEGAPLVVQPGATHSFVFRIHGAVAGLYEPRFDVDEVPGTYRVRLRSYLKFVPHGPVTFEQGGVTKTLQPLGDVTEPEDAISAPFELVVAR